MNVISELERLTEPPFKASPIRVLSRAEIEQLMVEGGITPLGRIPGRHMQHRVVVPVSWDRGLVWGWPQTLNLSQIWRPL